MTDQTVEQKPMGLMTYPAEGWRRWMFKAPLTLWRLGLGPLIGQYLIVITTTGRKSGLPRHTMTEYHTLPNGRPVVPCAFGERAQWFKNIQADPLVTIQMADGAESVRARRITADDELLTTYKLINRRNPVMLQWYLESVGVRVDPEDALAKKDRLVFVTFDPTDSPTPPALQTDLTWVWWILGVLLTLNLLANLFGRPRRD